jgi:hypothetical protein
MKDDTLEKNTNAAIAQMRARVEAHGVASVKVDDGEVFMFSKKMIESFAKKLEEQNQEIIVVFVKSGGAPVSQ